MRWGAWGLVALCCLACATAQAQDPVVPSEEQVALYLEGLAAHDAGRHRDAIARFRQALELGEINVIALALGRALFSTGACEEAEGWYARALSAPAVVSPSPDKVADRVEAYRADIRSGCPGELVLQCEPPHLTVSVGDEPAQPCAPAPRLLPAGTHALRGYLDEVWVETTVQIVGGESVTVTLRLPAPAAPRRAGETASPDRADPPDRLAVWGVGIGAVGLAGAAISWVLDLTLLDTRIDRYDSARAEYLRAPTSGGFDRLEHQRDAAARLRTGLTVSYLAAGALVVVGAGLASVSYFGDGAGVAIAPIDGGALLLIELPMGAEGHSPR